MTIRRIPVGDRPNGLALPSRDGLALAACIGDPTPPSLAILQLDSGYVLASTVLPGRPRWTVHNSETACFYLNIAAPLQILIVSAAPPFEVLRAIPISVPGPHGLDHDQRRGLLYCACDAAAVVAVEAPTGRIVAHVPTAGAPDVVFFNARRDRLYVAIGDPGVLQSIGTGAGRVVETIPTGIGRTPSASMRSGNTCTRSSPKSTHPPSSRRSDIDREAAGARQARYLARVRRFGRDAVSFQGLARGMSVSVRWTAPPVPPRARSSLRAGSAAGGEPGAEPDAQQRGGAAVLPEPPAKPTSVLIHRRASTASRRTAWTR